MISEGMLIGASVQLQPILPQLLLTARTPFEGCEETRPNQVQRQSAGGLSHSSALSSCKGFYVVGMASQNVLRAVTHR